VKRPIFVTKVLYGIDSYLYWISRIMMQNS